MAEKIEELHSRIKELEKEISEQCRINCIGQERELSLLAQLTAERARAEKAIAIAKSVVRAGCGNSGFYGQLGIKPGGCADSPHACVDCKARKSLAELDAPQAERQREEG